MYGVCMHNSYESKLCRKKWVLGMYRVVVDIAKAIRADLGKGICAYQEGRCLGS
jgi:hypothetical protein